MNKSEKFKQVFGIYAEEFWAKPEREMLEWIAEESEERTAKVETVEKPNVYKCSECGQYFHSTAWGSPVLFCSRCGAKLDWSWNDSRGNKRTNDISF